MGNLLGSQRYREPSTVEECDSTWETDSESEEPQDHQPSHHINITEPRSRNEPDSKEGDENINIQNKDTRDSAPKLKRSFYAAKDLYKYRHSYPNSKEHRQPSEYRNLRFYLNTIPLVPDGIYIEEILTKWKGDYEKLEHNHTYIQWLFPLREQGLNFYAQELTQAEIKEFQGTREAKRRFLVAYTVMLDFFGIKLLDKNGTVARAANWQDRFQHLNESQHNYLRITRILKSLGELGFESFKAPLVKLLLEEALVEETMPNMVHSALEYFVYTIRNRKERRALLRFAQLHYQPPEHFIWGLPKKRKPGAKINCTQEKNTARSKPTREVVAKNTASLHTSGDSSTGKTENNRSDKTENENQAKAANPASTDGQVCKTEEISVSEGERASKNGKPSVANKPKQANTFKKKPVQGGRVEKQNQK
ncbi:opioid growth factor receptor-like protein 1 isoform X2 [Acipenser oxyrinchus oxyrinchus]|uniref:Opioid growth factor receptor-like protein 1 isoform X2 n=1 Tax=Acipenser oxyrinchus oxyrinchus TaxID=40147 RepID=A0AAD8GC30_ACIOX|nr:opioid growth factor receptor-like protein 1 isoform X2 [Acipenser oxyrinchus oxyrinchus]